MQKRKQTVQYSYPVEPWLKLFPSDYIKAKLTNENTKMFFVADNQIWIDLRFDFDPTFYQTLCKINDLTDYPKLGPYSVKKALFWSGLVTGVIHIKLKRRCYGVILGTEIATWLMRVIRLVKDAG